MHQFQLMMQEVYTGSYNILLNAQGLVEWVPRCSPKLHFKVTCPHVAPTSRWKFIFSTLFKDCAIKHILVPALEESKNLLLVPTNVCTCTHLELSNTPQPTVPKTPIFCC